MTCFWYNRITVSKYTKSFILNKPLITTKVSDYKEVEDGNSVSVRERSGEGYSLTVDEFVAKLVEEDRNKIIRK